MDEAFTCDLDETRREKLDLMAAAGRYDLYNIIDVVLVVVMVM